MSNASSNSRISSLSGSTNPHRERFRPRQIRLYFSGSSNMGYLTPSIPAFNSSTRNRFRFNDRTSPLSGSSNHLGTARLMTFSLRRIPISGKGFTSSMKNLLPTRKRPRSSRIRSKQGSKRSSFRLGSNRLRFSLSGWVRYCRARSYRPYSIGSGSIRSGLIRAYPATSGAT